ncbi:MAG TPA: asparagine synthase (glutamine-hydrolyzing) [Thermoanaerobaculia bacterium]|jgi:asparagine synthase (glutamine-hydrolysing)|nr:asparagine synthase (glutamine-hydrolyzing) [Thermoanaerobaculia bacterium]
MCGILVTSGVNRPFHHRQLKSLKKRGPDEIGFWSDEKVQMAHARLSIIGLDERGTEPLENDRHVLIYNGEIYNFHEIKQRLNAEGIPVTGANDAEVLLHAWTRWGIDILKDLTGFWAFVIYDKHAQTVSLVRDQLGVKPLYYWHDGTKVCVSSLLKTVLEVGDAPRDLDYTALSEYVRYQFTFGDKTFIKSIKKVMPGHVVQIDLRSGEKKDITYEDIFAPRADDRQPITQAWIDQTRELIAQCVLDSTISDTSFTTFCSGGIDSSFITRLAGPDVAYHCNYSDSDCNETFFAKQVVADTSTRLLVVNAQEQFDLVQRCADIIEDFDELTIGSVILPLDDLLAQVKRRYKVILTGTGGDELFAGYVRYQLALGECYQDSYKALYAKMQGMTSAGARFELSHRKGDPTLFHFYQPEVEQTFEHAFDECRVDSDDLSAMLRFDRRYFLAGLLNIDDKMCGRHSLESRPSFLHQKLVRHVQHVDPREILPSNGDLKPVLRRLATDTLPRSVIHRTDKMGFTTPIGEFVNHNAHRIREQIQNSPFRDMYDLRKINFTAENKFSREVFGLMMLDLWLNRYATAH